jgi:ABC-2 type transport system permease protein
MTGLGPLLRKELLEQWRTRRLLVVTIVFVAFGIGSPFLARYTPELVAALAGSEFVIEVPPPTLADAIGQFLRNLGQTGVLAAILLAMGSVATEKERGTAALILTKPASRGAFLAAKAAGIGITLGVAVALAGVAGYVYTVLLFEAPSALGYAAMCALLVLQMAAYAAVTFLGSTLTRSAMAAAGLGIAALVIIAIVGALPGVERFTPGGLLGPAGALALGVAPGELVTPILASLAVIVIALGAAWLSFRRQEL